MRLRSLTLAVACCLAFGVLVTPQSALASVEGTIAISCKIDIVAPIGGPVNAQDCLGTANGIFVAPDGNIILIQGNPTWAAGKVTQPCGSDPKPRGGKCYDNFRAYDIVYTDTPLPTGNAWGRFEVACFDITKGSPCVINGSFDYTSLFNSAIVTIPSKHPLKDSKSKGTNGTQIKEQGKNYPICTANPQGGGMLVAVPKQVPSDGFKFTVWFTGSLTIAC